MPTSFIPSTPGFWCDYYACWKDNIVETINRMLNLHKTDFPETACVGFTIIQTGEMVKIFPKVAYRSRGVILDFYSGEQTEIKGV